MQERLAREEQALTVAKQRSDTEHARLAQEHAAAEAAQEQALLAREREEQQAMRETLKRAAVEERLQLASAKRLAKARQLQADAAQRQARTVQTADMTRQRNAADVESRELSAASKAAIAARSAQSRGSLSYRTAALLVVMLAIGSFFVTQHAPSVPAQAAQAVPVWPATQGFAAATTTLAAPQGNCIKTPYE